jgi:selenocysteine lyase/cysteine desulfurase
MFSVFSKQKNNPVATDQILNFDYLKPDTYYFDSACQTLRPQQVIDAEVQYYHEFNSCGHRVKYKWGEQTDRLVQYCRSNLLKLVNKSDKEYSVAFTLNTTFGINQVLQQIDGGFKQIITSEIEHNSVFLTSLTWAKRHNATRLVLPREEDGSLIYEKNQLENSIVILNTTSNIDARELKNAQQLAKDVHEKGGILLIDACQTFVHNPEILKNIEFDAVFGSGHKMNAPSVGFIIIKKSLLKSLDCFLIGGSTVSDVKLDSYELIQDESELYARIEPGLQNYAGIIGLNAAIKWRQGWKITVDDVLQEFNKSGKKEVGATEYENLLSLYLNKKLKELPQITLLNNEPSPVVSLYTDKIDGHKLAMYLSEVGVMCRSGYHCCHYYLKQKLNLPPLFRISLGLNNTPEQIDFIIEKLKVLVD